MTKANWLLLDTTGVGCHVALVHQGELTQQSDWQPQSHTKQILPMIDALLSAQQLQVSDLDAIIYTQGPGSFTGVRVGVSVVQGLAFAHQLPTLGISTLMALAWQGYQLSSHTPIAAVLDARMNQLYWGVYDFARSVHPIIPDRIDNVHLLWQQPLPPMVAGDVSIVIEAAQSAGVSMQSTETWLPLTHVDMRSLYQLVDYAVANQQLTFTHELPLPIYLRHDVAHLPKK